MNDKQFTNQFSAILILLVGISVVILIIARMIAHQPEKQDLAMKHIVEERIKPVGEVHVGNVSDQPNNNAMANAEGKKPASTSDSSKSNESIDPAQVYETVCAACHQTGLLNAPIYGDKARWAPLLGDVDELYAVALTGKGAMPAKGGRADLSDATIKAVVDYMVKAVR